MFAVVAFSVLYLYLLIVAIIPYLRFDQSQYWDLPVHLFAAWFNRFYTFPDFTGWNPFFFGGYPQNIFYGPLYSYIVALISFPVGLLAAQKIVTVLSLVALPLSIYYFLRKYGFDSKESSLMVLLSMFPLVTLDLACGGTLYSLFYVGLGPHALPLPLFFIYIGKLKEQCDKIQHGKIKRVSAGNFLFMTLLVSSIILTHFVVTLATFIAAVIIVSTKFNLKILAFSIKHAITAFLCSAFFLIPFFTYAGGIKDGSSVLSMGFFLTIPVFFLILFGGAAAILDKEKRFDRSFFTLIAAFAIIIFIDFGQFGLPMDAYRFIFFFLVFAMMLPAKMLLNNIQNKPIKNGLVVLFILLFSVQIFTLLSDTERAKINRNRLFFYKDMNIPYEKNIKLGKLNGRLTVFERKHRRIPHPLRHLIAMQTQNQLLKGTFAESSANAHASLGLYRKIVRFFSMAKKLSIEDVGKVKYTVLNLKKLLNHFQVNYILSEFPLKKVELVKRVKVRRDQRPFYLYQLGDAKMVELLPYIPYTRDNNWDHWSKKWMASPDPKILVKAKKLPKFIAAKDDTVEIIGSSISPTRLRFKVNALHDVPILIKVSYFPCWKAFADGKPIRIYEVAPSLMLVYGKGNIELKYELGLVGYLGYLLTFVGIGILALEFLFQKKRRGS